MCKLLIDIAVICFQSLLKYIELKNVLQRLKIKGNYLFLNEKKAHKSV